jgi:hypothetical protein
MKDRNRPEDLSKLAEAFDLALNDRIDPSLARIAARIEREVTAGRMTLEEAHDRLTQAPRR